MTVSRNPEAVWCIPTENEWYKAAYYDPSLNGGSGGYWLYPTKSNSVPTNVLSATGTNNANFETGSYPNYVYTDPTNYLTAVGTFASSPSAYGTFDQGGDVWQWNEAIIPLYPFRGLRGGSYYDLNGYNFLLSGYSSYASPTNENYDFGFRVSQVPEPGGLGFLSLGVIGMLVRRRGARR